MIPIFLLTDDSSKYKKTSDQRLQPLLEDLIQVLKTRQNRESNNSLSFLLTTKDFKKVWIIIREKMSIKLGINSYSYSQVFG